MTEEFYNDSLKTPVGLINIKTDREFLLSVSFVENAGTKSVLQPGILQETIKQLKEYFEGTRKEFTVKMNPRGTDFQKKVWEQLTFIPFGESVSYNEIAKKLGSAKYARAVGLANRNNPVAIVIPCHRVLGANGKLTGYAGGLERKSWLLKHELKHSDSQHLLF